jgi:hypothetical protein
MWLFTRYGFYSIACARKPDGSIDREQVMIRARRIAHLENLQARFPALSAAEVLTLPNRDYGYRVIVPKGLWAGFASELAQEQEWSNSKCEAEKRQGEAGVDYIRALHNVWHVMSTLQESEYRPAPLERN